MNNNKAVCIIIVAVCLLAGLLCVLDTYQDTQKSAVDTLKVYYRQRLQ